ncbi:MAG TPA: hypothetical protein VKX46_06110, partial [Ktedonobacteraceae bacterium]|nr:hypothetical protein [Ktedonobacteraceae bacterium]
RQSPPARLAYHAQQAGMVHEAFHYLIQAGNEAMNMFAVQDAISSYKTSLSLLDKHQRMLSEADTDSIEDVKQLYWHLGRAYEVLEQWEQAGQVYENMLNFARRIHQPKIACIALNQRALLAIQQGFDIDRAIDLLQQAYTLVVERQDPRMEVEVAWSLAQIFVHVWRLHEAERHGLRALELARQLHLLELEARSFFVLTEIYRWLGHYEQTVDAATHAIDLYTKLSAQTTLPPSLPTYIVVSGAMPSFQATNQSALVGALVTRFIGYVGLGNLQAALADGQRALSMSQAMKNISLQAWSLTHLNHVFIEAGQYEAALRTASQAHNLIHTSTNVLVRYYVLIVLGCSYQALFQLEKAQDILEEALALVQYAPSTEQQLLATLWLSTNQALLGRWEQAATYAREALRLQEQTETVLLPKGFAATLPLVALLHVGDVAAAREMVQQSGAHVGTNPRTRTAYLHTRALLSQAQGEKAQAISDGQEALQLANDLGLPGEQWLLQAMLGELYAQQGLHEREQEAMTQAAEILRRLAEQIQDDGLRASFLAASQVRHILEWHPDEEN